IPSRQLSAEEAADPLVWGSLEAELGAILKAHVTREIGAIARPRDIIIVPDLPKTRSGKIMRRLLGDIFDGRELGDVTSLQDESVPAAIAGIVEAARS
ncbi:MAG: acetyl-CoA synthetase, partial [Actinomycetota bacterium]|nr:acetyl-CoA synthetase [Actinomycetota bacterium]